MSNTATLHGYTLHFVSYGLWRIQTPGGTWLPEYYRTRALAVAAIKRRTGRR